MPRRQAQWLGRENYQVTKNVLLGVMITLFLAADVDARHDDIYESSIAVVLALYVYLKADKKSADMHHVLTLIQERLDSDIALREEDHMNHYHQVLTALQRRNYLKKGWQWTLLKHALILASLMKMAYGALTIAAVEKALNREDDWLQILFTVLGSVSSIVLLAASIFSSIVSQSYYLASEFKHFLDLKYPEDNAISQADSSNGNENAPLLGGPKSRATIGGLKFFGFVKSLDVKSWWLNFFLALNSVSEVISVWNLISQPDARSLEDTELLFLLVFMAFDMFLNITQAKVLRYQQGPKATAIEKSWFVESKTGVALTILSVLIPIVAKTTHLILGIVARDPDNLDGLSCDTLSCRWMTGLSFAGLFALPAVGINGHLGHVRTQLYESGLMLTSQFGKLFKRITGAECPAPYSEHVDAHGFEEGFALISRFEA